MAEEKSVVLSTPAQIATYRLAVLKQRLKLEMHGLKSKQALRPQIAAEFGLKPLDKYPKFIAAIQAKIDENIAAMEAKNRSEIG